MEKRKEKVYITRDEDSDIVWIWKKPTKGNWSPQKFPNCDIINWQRENTDNADCYVFSDFKKKFGITIRTKTKKCVHISTKLLNNEDYKLFSNNPDRKK